MQKIKSAHNVDKDALSLLDVVQLIKTSYKKILLSGFCGLLVAICFTYVLGQYTASITYLNSARIDLPRLKYLQAALPKLSQQESVNGTESFLSSEQLWKSAVIVKNLVVKSDAKDILDPAALQSGRFNIYAIEILGIANSKYMAEKRAQEFGNYFISGTTFIDLRDLVQQYELNVTTANAKLVTKILNAEVELAYIDRRIKNLNEIKKQYPAGVIGQNNSLQLTDAKDDGAKYLPILTQIIAATADQNNQNELLLRYREEGVQMRIYASFL